MMKRLLRASKKLDIQRKNTVFLDRIAPYFDTEIFELYKKTMTQIGAESDSTTSTVSSFDSQELYSEDEGEAYNAGWLDVDKRKDMFFKGVEKRVAKAQGVKGYGQHTGGKGANGPNQMLMNVFLT